MDDHMASTEPKILTYTQVSVVLDKINFRHSCVDMGWEWTIESVPIPGSTQPKGWLICCSFQRPDTETGKIGRGFGRKEFVAWGSTVSGVVKTAWVCVEKTVYHELMEAFQFQGVRVFDPHRSVYALTGTTWTDNK